MSVSVRRRSHRQRPGRARRRYRVRPARRADLRPVRRLPPGAAEGDRRAARAGLRLHGLRLCALERQARRVQRGARPRRAQRQCGAAHRVRLQRAGAVPDRPGADAISRQGPRPSARDAGPARDAAHLRQMGRPHRISRRRARDGRARLPGNAVGPPRPGVAGNAVGRVHPARARSAGAGLRSLARAPARPRSHQGGGRADQGQQEADDLCRQRRDPCARGNPRTGRDDRCAGRRLPQRPRHRLQRA